MCVCVLGSFFLQAAVECAPVDLLLPLISAALLLRAEGSPAPAPEPAAAAHTKIVEYAQDGVANFVLQSILRRLTAELSPSPSSSPSSYPSSAVKDAAETILQALSLVSEG